MAEAKSSLLHGKRVVITGAGKGIGKAISLAVASNGADVCVASRTSKDVESLLVEIHAKFGVKAVGVVADISKNDDVSKVVDKSVRELGGVDALVCAAGYPMVPTIWESKLHELGEDDFLRVFETDVLGSFKIIKAVLPVMIRQNNGVIVVFSSTPAIAGYSKGGPYTVAKAANLGLVKEIASEYGEKNIRAYAVAPGNIRTQRTFDQLSESEKEALANESPMKRWGEPSEVAQVVSMLVSDKFSFVTGQTIVVDGGTVML